MRQSRAWILLRPTRWPKLLRNDAASIHSESGPSVNHMSRRRWRIVRRRSRLSLPEPLWPKCTFGVSADLNWPRNPLRRPVSAKSDANPYAVLSQKFYAARFQRRLYRVERASPWPYGLVLDHVQRYRRYGGLVRERGLGPLQQAAGCADLGGADHERRSTRNLKKHKVWP